MRFPSSSALWLLTPLLASVLVGCAEGETELDQNEATVAAELVEGRGFLAADGFVATLFSGEMAALAEPGIERTVINVQKTGKTPVVFVVLPSKPEAETFRAAGGALNVTIEQSRRVLLNDTAEVQSLIGAESSNSPVVEFYSEAFLDFEGVEADRPVKISVSLSESTYAGQVEVIFKANSGY